MDPWRGVSWIHGGGVHGSMEGGGSWIHGPMEGKVHGSMENDKMRSMDPWRKDYKGSMDPWM